MLRSAQLYERALVAYERTVGPNDPRVATVLENLAAVHERTGNLTARDDCLARARQIRGL